MIPRPAIIDFETKPILRRPLYPPKPVSVSIKKPGERKARFWSWGHPTDNNCTFTQARRALLEVWRSGDPLLFHHGKFDVEVAVTHCDLPMPRWDRIHDTMFLSFLDFPYAYSFKLKQLAHELLDMPPEERDVVEDWLKEHCPHIRERDPDSGELLPWSAYISEAPGTTIVGPYANGDVTRTDGIFKLLYPQIIERGMLQAYNRERELMPILMENEREGVCVDVDLLDSDVEQFTQSLNRADNWLRRRLKSPSLNLDSNEEFADALERNDLVDPGAWVYTRPTKRHPGGVRSVSKKNLTPEMIDDPRVAQAYDYRNRLKTCLGTFMRTWQRMAHHKGRIYTSWSQVRNSERGTAGAATGRLQSSPNFQNIPNEFDGTMFPAFLKCPPLPLMRKYLIPDSKNHLWGHRDYNQQELRILAHYEDGELLQSYLDDPDLDVHGIVHDGLLSYGYNFARRPVKVFDFQNIYGGGVPAVMNALKCDAVTAKKCIAILMECLPGYKELSDDIKSLGKAGKPIITWGGREYYAEMPRYSEEEQRVRTFEYKLLNYLIQGSAADCTKQALINYHNHPKRTGRMLIPVHDEINFSALRRLIKMELKVLNEAMLDVKFGLPMLSKGKFGPRWSELQLAA